MTLALDSMISVVTTRTADSCTTDVPYDNDSTEKWELVYFV